MEVVLTQQKSFFKHKMLNKLNPQVSVFKTELQTKANLAPEQPSKLMSTFVYAKKKTQQVHTCDSLKLNGYR